MASMIEKLRHAWSVFWLDLAHRRRALADRIENDWYGLTEGAPLPKGSMTEWQVETNRALADFYDALAAGGDTKAG